MRRAIPALFVAALLIPPQTADEWPGFRGQERQGVGDGRVGPTHWSSTTNIAWKTRLPGSGHSSPVVIGLAESHPGEAVTATPAAGDGHLYLRGHEHLYCFRP